MRTTRLFLVAAVLLIAGLAALFSNFKGSVNLTGAFPLHAASFAVNGAAEGTWAAIGTIVTFAGVVLFAIAIISAIALELRGARRP